MSRISEVNIEELNENEIFVFGSNLSGIHGAGAAKAALQWGAEYGKGIGHYGRTYAIPTKGYIVQSTKQLPILIIEDIRKYVYEFIEYAKSKPDLKFLVTEIGCGLAGYTYEQIAPLFADAINVENIYLPFRFVVFLKKTPEGIFYNKLDALKYVAKEPWDYDEWSGAHGYEVLRNLILDPNKIFSEEYLNSKINSIKNY